MIFFRKLHKWLGLVIGAQLIVWLVTGTIISLIDQDEVSGSVTRSMPSSGLSLSKSEALYSLSMLPLADSAIRSVTLGSLLEQPIYRVERDDSSVLYEATTGKELPIDQQLAENIAVRSYRGTGNVVSSERQKSGSDEVRNFPGSVWRIDFDDSLTTRVYVSAEDGQILAHRNSRWKIVDFLLMLHFMDYVRADSFNNPQIIVVGFGALWIAMSGLLLVFYSFSRSDFLWLPGMRSRGRLVNILIKSDSQPGHSLELDSSMPYYASLSQAGIKLPSNCDGSGSCGLCKIHYEGNVPEHTAVDREWISEDSLAHGIRLGCQHKPRLDDSVSVPDIAFQQNDQWADVVSSSWLTPLLKEIRLRPDTSLRFSSGDYLEFQIPNYQIDIEQLAVPDSFSGVWDQLTLPGSWLQPAANGESRTYSIAVAPNQVDPQELVFNVRFAPPPAESNFLPGVGSSYMCGLQDGDRIAFRGPAGDFRLVESDREKILIGGGAGMAPLKSMTLHLLENLRWQGKLRFWYGARNQQEILYRETFEALAINHANFEWEVALSDSLRDVGWRGHAGFIHEAVFERVLRNHPTLGDCEFYLCGPPQMLRATRKMLRELGVADVDVRFDDFGN